MIRCDAEERAGGVELCSELSSAEAYYEKNIKIFVICCLGCGPRFETDNSIISSFRLTSMPLALSSSRILSATVQSRTALASSRLARMAMISLSFNGPHCGEGTSEGGEGGDGKVVEVRWWGRGGGRAVG